MPSSARRIAAASIVAAQVLSSAGRGASAQTAPDRSAEVLAAARAALGGESRLAAVKTLVATGRTRQLRGDNLVPIEFEIQVEFPDRYARRDEFPAQDNGPATTGFSGARLVQDPPAPVPPPRAGAPPLTPEQQAAALAGPIDAVKQDFARLMLGMFASSFGSFPLTFVYVAQAEAPQGKADVLDVTGPANFRARLFISADTHLPIMVTWQAAPPPARRGGPPPGAGPPAGTSGPRSAGPPPGAGAGPAAPPVEQRLYFADYRSVDGLQWPFRIRRAVGADTTEETIFDRFRINARVDARRFQ